MTKTTMTANEILRQIEDLDEKIAGLENERDSLYHKLDQTERQTVDLGSGVLPVQRFIYEVRSGDTVLSAGSSGKFGLLRLPSEKAPMWRKVQSVGGTESVLTLYFTDGTRISHMRCDARKTYLWCAA